MRKILKVILCLLLLGLAAGAVLLGLRFYPAYKGAGFLQNHMSLRNLTFDLTVTLSEERFTEEQRKFVSALSEISGIEQQDLSVLQLQGAVYGKDVYVKIMPRGWNEPLTELYLGEEADLVNAAMLYRAVQENLSGKYAAAEFLMPQWKGGEYVSLEQAEQMFGLDLSAAKTFEPATYEELLSFWNCFLMLAVMDSGKNEAGEATFTAAITKDILLNGAGTDPSYMELENADFAGQGAETAKIQITLEETGETPAVSINGAVADMPGFLKQADALLAKVGAEHSFSEKKGLQNIQKIDGSIVAGNALEIRWPDSLVQQETVEKIATIRSLIQELTAR